jgi:hypothetical protein
MGKMMTVKTMMQLMEEWTLPNELNVSWKAENSQEVTYAEKKFKEYLADGWMAFSDNPDGRKQIFNFNPQTERIILIPPLGGG